MEQGLVSVVVPVFNAQNTLSRCVDSILGQTYGKIELLLVDDGSKDASPDLCDQIAKEDPRVKVFHVGNNGAAAARNLGIEHACGEYLTFVDSDDYIDLDNFEVLLGLLVSKKADIACGAVKYVPGPTIARGDAVLGADEFLAALLYKDGVGDYPVCKIYKAFLFEGLRYTEHITSEDFDILYRLFSRVNTAALTDRTSYYYVQYASSVSNSANGSKYLNRLDIASSILEIIREKHPRILGAAKCRLVSESIWVYGLLGKSDVEAKRSIKAIVHGNKKGLILDKAVPGPIRRRILIFCIAPCLWTLRMKLKRFYISVRNAGL